MKILGRFLKSRRLASGLSQGKLGKALGYGTPQYISNWERGLCGFPLGKARKFCKATDTYRMDLEAELIAAYIRELRRSR